MLDGCICHLLAEYFTIHNRFESLVQLLASSLEVGVIITTAERTMIHQLKSDVYRHTVVARQHIPAFLNVLKYAWGWSASSKSLTGYMMGI